MGRTGRLPGHPVSKLRRGRFRGAKVVGRQKTALVRPSV